MRMRIWVGAIAVATAIVAGCERDTEAAREPATGTEDTLAIPAEARAIWERYGGARFDGVEWIRFTWNVEAPGRKVSRAWLWYPGLDSVVFVGEFDGTVDTVAYARAAVTGNPDSEDEIAQVDKWFINDSYWFLFPLHLGWDDVAIAEDGRQPLPIGEGEAKRINVRYPQMGGYTPGDMYRLYYDDNHDIVAWTYHRGGQEEVSRAARWVDTRDVGPIRLSLSRPGEGGFRVYFTGVAVKEREAAEPVVVPDATPVADTLVVRR